MKGTEALQEYQRMVKSGEIVRAEALNPIEKAKANPKSLRLAINAKCYDCTCYSRAEVTNCEITGCSLWAIRPWQRKQV